MRRAGNYAVAPTSATSDQLRFRLRRTMRRRRHHPRVHARLEQRCTDAQPRIASPLRRNCPKSSSPAAPASIERTEGRDELLRHDDRSRRACVCRQPDERDRVAEVRARLLGRSASGGEASGNVRARGIPVDGFGSITLLEDGLPVQNDPSLGYLNGDQAFRLDETIDRIEVVRGGPSSIFYSNAPAGAVNLHPAPRR